MGGSAYDDYTIQVINRQSHPSGSSLAFPSCPPSRGAANYERSMESKGRQGSKKKRWNGLFDPLMVPSPPPCKKKRAAVGSYELMQARLAGDTLFPTIYIYIFFFGSSWVMQANNSCHRQQE